MKIVRVTYTTKPEYAEQNQKNIQAVMADLQKTENTDMYYTVCLLPDQRSFMHTSFFNNETAEQLLLTLPSFKYFQEQLKLNGLESPPKQELLSLVGASRNIF